VVLPSSISRLEVGARQPVFQFGVGDSAAQRARAMEQVADAELRRAELDTALSVREAFLAAARARALRAVAAKGLDAALQHQQLGKAMVAAGALAPAFALDFDRGVAEARATVSTAESGAAIAMGNLNRQLARPIESQMQLDEPPSLPPDPEPQGRLQARALAGRPEAATVRASIQQALAGIRLARAQRLPHVSIEVSLALQTPTALLPGQGLSAGVSVRMPLFAKAVQRQSVREAEERLEQAKVGLQALEAAIALEVYQHRLGMLDARSRIGSGEAAVQAAEQAASVKLLLIERGRATPSEQMSAELAVTKSRADLAGARFDLHLARARLDRALGEGLPADASTPPAAGGRSDGA
jgi:outer membrane protein TolC